MTTNIIYCIIVLTKDYHSEILLLIVPWVTEPLIASSLGPFEGISLSSSPVIQTTIGPKTQKNVSNQKNKHAKVKKSNMMNKWTLAINKGQKMLWKYVMENIVKPIICLDRLLLRLFHRSQIFSFSLDYVSLFDLIK